MPSVKALPRARPELRCSKRKDTRLGPRLPWGVLSRPLPGALGWAMHGGGISALGFFVGPSSGLAGAVAHLSVSAVMYRPSRGEALLLSCCRGFRCHLKEVIHDYWAGVCIETLLISHPSSSLADLAMVSQTLEQLSALEDVGTGQILIYMLLHVGGMAPLAAGASAGQIPLTAAAAQKTVWGLGFGVLIL